MPNTIGTTPGSGRLARVADLGAGDAFAQYIAAVTGPYRVVGYDFLTVANTVITLGTDPSTIPAGATHALLQVETTDADTDTDGVRDAIRFRQDNISPTSTVGMLLEGGTVMDLCPISVSGGDDVSELDQVKLIAAQTGQSMKVNIEYRAYAAA